ncbi:PEP/pyruvate-binding domain-containing protein [Streptomyces showdoensis]|uniref:PEP/pyruvate-binding domain-containing protein n=1 Tax=Streptomyces showdoensis TaxID=68268 RepID=UPI000F4E0CE3|nr:PEP/pyruvate-binding domain-containing protein [Streptomyces showdoensis]
MEFVLPLDAAAATLEAAGGKGAALSEPARAGLPVPGGFHVTTAAYREFVTSTGVSDRIRARRGRSRRRRPGHPGHPGRRPDEPGRRPDEPGRRADSHGPCRAGLAQ